MPNTRLTTTLHSATCRVRELGGEGGGREDGWLIGSASHPSTSSALKSSHSRLHAMPAEGSRLPKGAARGL
ncbi:hypothetical protein HaLaN_12565 [Haematococcus lacustris]|uniref:Uncharacterized protein n=1 Tax=Haematococcus lacustris TaxID=44745 RepID=A0A699Z3P9_HAELA|nr:hypothetical protein HaLaN_12565 [Haematococcus lacustris]